MTAQIFEELCFLIPEDGPLAPPTELAAASPCVSVSFNGPFAGRLYLATSEELAEVIAANMLGVEPEIANETRVDALGELANVLCGRMLPHITDFKSVFELGSPSPDPANPEALPGDTIELSFEEGAARVSFEFEPGAELPE